MLFAIDIDATIATDRNGYARYLNNKLKLGIEESVIEQIKCYHDFRSLPAVQNYLQEPERRDYYQTIYNRLQHEPEIQQNLDTLPNAVQALNNQQQHSYGTTYVFPVISSLKARTTISSPYPSRSKALKSLLT